MLNFKIFKQEILIEAKIDQLKQKYTDKMRQRHDPEEWNKLNWKLQSVDLASQDDVIRSHEHELIDDIHHSDPHPRKSNTEWMIRQYNNAEYKREDLPSVADTLNHFERFKKNLPAGHRDINNHQSLSDLRNILRPHIEKSQKKSNSILSGADLIHDKDGVKVYHAKTKEAMCELGSGMPWCTARRDDRNMFQHYTKDGSKHYVVHLAREQAPYRKLGVIFEKNEFQDENNQNIERSGAIHELIKRNPELQEIPEFQGRSPNLTKDINKHFDKFDLNKYDVRSSLLKHPNLSSENLEKMMHHIDNMDENEIGMKTLYHHDIAEHLNADENLLDKLARKNEEFISSRVAAHPNVSDKTLFYILKNSEAIARMPARRALRKRGYDIKFDRRQ